MPFQNRHFNKQFIPPIFCLMLKFKDCHSRGNMSEHFISVHLFIHVIFTVEFLLKGRPTGHKNLVFQDRWSLQRGSFTLKCIGPSAKNMWSFKTGGLSLEWSFKIGFPVFHFDIMAYSRTTFFSRFNGFVISNSRLLSYSVALQIIVVDERKFQQTELNRRSIKRNRSAQA